MTDTQEGLRRHVEALLEGEHAHKSFEAATEGYPAGRYGDRPPGASHSAWQLVEHVRIAQRDILDFCVNPAYEEIAWPDDYWPDASAPVSPEEWRESLVTFRRDREELLDLLQDPRTDLLAPVPHGQGQTFLREFLLVADHTAYHTGQLIQLRKLLGCWPS